MHYASATFPSPLSFTPPENPSPNLQAVIAYVAARNATQSAVAQSSAKSLALIEDCFADNLEHRIIPKSLGRPVLNKKQYIEYLAGLPGIFKTFHVSSHLLTERTLN